MAVSLKVFTLVIASLLCVKTVTSDGLVPVFIWGDLAKPSIKTNALDAVNEADFTEYLTEVINKDIFTVIFTEETLSVEDLSRKNDDGSTAYPYLHSKIGKSIYFPSVDYALKALNSLAQPDRVDHLKLTENGLSSKIEPEPGKFVFINLKDAKPDESRSELLKRHNDFIQKTFDELKEKHTNVVGIYTAHFPSWTITEEHIRSRRQAETGGSTEFYGTPDILVYVRNLQLKVSNDTKPLTGGVITSVRSDPNITATLKFESDTVHLNFHRRGGYWFLNSIDLDETSEGATVSEPLHGSEVYALESFSYRCGQSVSFSSINTTKSYTLTFDDVQVQPFFDNRTEAQERFGEPFNCVGFTSVPIWSGLFVVFILLAITFYGIMMMMDIRTMDRFDDPKGKTITISATD